MRVAFDRSVKVELTGAAITSDFGVLLYRELEDRLGLMDIATGSLRDMRRGKNGSFSLKAMLRH